MQSISLRVNVSHFVRSVLWGSVAVVAFDTLVSLAARTYGFPYSRSNLLANILFLGIGFFTARGSVTHPVRTAALAGAIVGAFDATVGGLLGRRQRQVSAP
jgi:hypothetical protein